VRASRGVVAALVVVLVLLGAPTAAGASCSYPAASDEPCHDTIETRSTNGWVLIPLGLGIGALAAVGYVLMTGRPRRRAPSPSPELRRTELR